MQRYAVTLTTRSPVAISRSRATGNQIETLGHIPGTVWRGALAAQLGAAHPEFAAIFLSGRVRFGDLRLDDAVPWPLSARRCAVHPGHRMLDLLLVDDPPIECAECEAKLVMPGNLRLGSGARKTVRRVTTHTAISNYTLRIRPEQFFSTEVLERDQKFQGVLTASDALVAQTLLGKRELWIGRGATRGQGMAELNIQNLQPPVPNLNWVLRQQQRQPDVLSFTATLLSPCIVYDRYLLARAYITAEDIAEAAGEPGALRRYELAPRWFSRLATISGWNAQASLPKSDITAISPGSAFLFQTTVSEREIQDERARLADILERASAGLGERWAEGFGEVSFQDNFHWEFRHAR